ncbi:MAG TPA: glycoside hydrolase family 76 protein [Solirubrobacteraceae bacterium]|nr:glycoside hydrolase family 76 protein [Solirubrobacteraceae bacterium]
MTAAIAQDCPPRASAHLARRGLLLLVLCTALGVLAAQTFAAPALAAQRSASAKASRKHGASRAHGASRTRGTSRTSTASRYPSGTSRPFAHPRSGVLARSAASKAKAPKKPAKPVLTGNPARALSAYEAMQRYYYVRGSGLYEGEPFSFLWPFSQAFAATVSMANVPKLPIAFAPELHARLIGLRNYLDTNNSGAPEGTFTSTLAAFDGTVAPPTGPGGAKYYDDNDWIGIELARIYKKTRNSGALGYAEGIMAFEMAGYSTDPTLACPGGIPFSNLAENTDRNTITTGPAAELGVQLYKITGNVAYLQFAETAYNWVRTCLLQPSGLYADHIRPHGVLDTTFWSYNQGVMIGAGTLLYQATGNSAYLFQARQTAQAARAYFTPQRLGEENPFFPSVYFRNILYLDSVTHDPPGPKLAQAYVDYAWSHLRLSDNLFVAGSPASAQLLYQAAIVQIYALLSSPPSTYF